MSETNGVVKEFELAPYREPLRLPNRMQGPKTANTGHFVAQAEDNKQRVGLIGDVIDATQEAVKRMETGNQRNFVEGLEDLKDIQDGITDPWVKALATAHLAGVVNHLGHGMMGVTQLGVEAAADVAAERIEAPPPAPVVIEVPVVKPGLVKRLAAALGGS